MGKKIKKRKTGRLKESLEGQEYPGKIRGETQLEITRKDDDLLRSKPIYSEDTTGEEEEDEEDSFYNLGGDDHDDLAEDQGGINI